MYFTAINFVKKLTFFSNAIKGEDGLDLKASGCLALYAVQVDESNIAVFVRQKVYYNNKTPVSFPYFFSQMKPYSWYWLLTLVEFIGNSGTDEISCAAKRILGHT